MDDPTRLDEIYKTFKSCGPARLQWSDVSFLFAQLCALDARARRAEAAEAEIAALTADLDQVVLAEALAADMAKATIELEQSSARRLREALEGLVYQFGYEGGLKDGRPAIFAGGLSALEDAFDALGWDDPHLIPAADVPVSKVAHDH